MAWYAWRKKRLDWQNPSSGLGIAPKDKRITTKYVGADTIDDATLTELYKNNGLAKRIVDVVAQEMVRAWFTTDDKIMQQLKALNAKQEFLTLIKWARLYGGAIMLMFVDDGQTLDKPMRAKRITGLKVFDRSQIHLQPEDFYQDPRNPKFGQPQWYRVQRENEFRIHETRVLRIDGEKGTSGHWGTSVLQHIYREIQDVDTAYNATSQMFQDLVQSILFVDNLGDILASGNQNLIMERLNLINEARSVYNTILLDNGERYEKLESSLNNVDQLLNQFTTKLASVTNIPQSILLGRSPTGLNATGDMDIRMWYDSIKMEQEDVLRPQLERLITLLGYNGEIHFTPLWQSTEKEEMELKQMQANIDVSYIQNNVLDPAEVAALRFELER